MGATLELLSGPRGSNPGGTCVVSTEDRSFRGYFKYCYGTKIQGASSFRASHQPIYEALTFQLVRELGLKTMDFYILMNHDKSVHFPNWRAFRKELSDPSGRNFYFVSAILPPRQECSEQRSNELIRKAAPYLESILVADIIGKRQNYKCYSSQAAPRGEIIYLDLGCSFVYAKQGYLSLPHRAPPYESHVFRSIVRQLSHYTLLSPQQRLINLATLIESIPHLRLPMLNPFSFESVDALLCDDEIQEIQNYLSHGLLRNVSLLRQQEILTNEGSVSLITRGST